MERYFAYGSNMLPRQMTKRCPSARYLGVRRLGGFRLIFNRKGSYRPGAVASVEVGKIDQDAVLGALWEISAEDLATMDSIEDPDAYVRIAVPVSKEGRGSEYAWTYVSYPDGMALAPDSDYLDVMLEGAREIGLPKNYLKDLKGWRV